jgi:hypothetical protein
MNTLGLNPFNGDYFLQAEYSKLIEKHKPDLLLETGSFEGITTEYMCRFGPPVIQFFDIVYGKDKYVYRYNEEAAGARRGVIFLEPIETERDNTLV